MAELVYLHGVATLRQDTERCTGCGACLEVCPQAVFVRQDEGVRIAALDHCMECGACWRNCPEGALTVTRGVGCAEAVINAALGRKGSSCCCSLDAGAGGGASSCC